MAVRRALACGGRTADRARGDPRDAAWRRCVRRCRRAGGRSAAVSEFSLSSVRDHQITVALVERIKASGGQITDADLDSIRNVCRCGTYPRIREAIAAAAANM